ncbi:hypothetical protein Tco_0212500 [Tanacetum coccineum]
MALLITIRTNNSRTRGKILAGLTLQGTGRRNITADLSRCILNTTITIMVHVLPNATSATELAIWPVTVGVLQMPILLTTKEALGQVRRLLAMNVGIKGTTGEEEKPIKTITTWRKISCLRHYIFKNSHCISLKSAVGSFKMLEQVESIAYKLGLPQELSTVHNTFHVSNLRKYYADEPLAVPLDELHFDDKLRFVEKPAEIMDREVKRLRQSRVPIVKVRWNSRRGPEFT